MYVFNYINKTTYQIIKADVKGQEKNHLYSDRRMQRLVAVINLSIC